MSSRRWLTLLAALLVTATALPIAAPHRPALAAGSDPVAWGDACGSARLGLERVTVRLAPALERDPDTNPDGTPVRIRPDRRGRHVPVIMVHGWVGRSTHDEGRDGAFSHRIDLTANRLGTVTPARSLVGQLQRIPGAAVFTFDFRHDAARWVDDARLGPALGKVIDCLYQAAGEKVIVVGHSMGGLVTRYAASRPGVTGPDRAGEISTVVTFGTPATGSIAASVAASAADSNALAVVHLVLSACGRLATDEVGTGTICDTLPPPARAFSSDAGRALRAGSPQLAALKPFPKGITVDTLAGGATFHLPGAGWFALPWTTSAVPVGDLIVTAGSARQGGALGRSASCAYQLNAVRGTTDFAGLLFGLVSRADVAQQPLASLTGACFHTNLMRSIELTNEAIGAVSDDIEARQAITAADLLAAPVPASCRHRAGTLRDGELPGIPEGEGEMMLAWKARPGSRPDDVVALGDLTGDGAGDAAAVLYCNAGGVSWPEMVAFYAPGPRLLGAVLLSDVNLPGNEPGSNDFVHRLRYRDGAVLAEWTTQQRGDPSANGTLDYSAALRWDGRRINVSGLTGTTERQVLDRFTAGLAGGGAERLAAPGAAAQAATLFRTYPAAAGTGARCFGTGTFDLPPGAADDPVIANSRSADRVCLFATGALGTPWIALGMRRTGFRQWRVEWARLT